MAAVYLKNLVLNLLSYSHNAGYCWEDLPSLCFGPGFPRSDFTFAPSRPIVTAAAKASRYEYGYLTLPTPTIPLPMTITMAPGALRFPNDGITKPGLVEVMSSPGDYFSTGQLRYIFLACMISMWIGLFVNHFGNRKRASACRAEVDRWAVAYQRLERESQCRAREQAERSERQKRHLVGTLHSQQLRLGTKSRAMRDRLTRRHHRSLSRVQDEVTRLRKELRKAQTKPTAIHHGECQGLIANLQWQFDQARLVIIKQSSTIMRRESRIDFLQGRVNNFVRRELHPDTHAHQLELDLKFRLKQIKLMNHVCGASSARMLDSFKEESALILVQLVKLENRIEAKPIENDVLQAKWQRASTLILQPQPTETSVQSQALSNDEETIDALVSQLSIMEEELRQARADLDAKADHRSESPSAESKRDEAYERLSIENFNIQESNHQLKSDLCETQVKLGRVTRCLQDALLSDRPATVSKTHELSTAELDNDHTRTTLIKPSTNATKPARRSSIYLMERLQDSRGRPFVPHRHRSMSAATPVSDADGDATITCNTESMSLRETIAVLRLVHGDISTQSRRNGSVLPEDDDHNEEPCSIASQSGDGPKAEDDRIYSPFDGQRPNVPKGKTNRRRRKAKGAKDVEAMDA